jgi:hypothetical protein
MTVSPGEAKLAASQGDGRARKVAGTADKHRQFIRSVLRKEGAEDAPTLVERLRTKFPDLDDEQAGDLIWQLIEERELRVTEDADLEAADARAR